MNAKDDIAFKMNMMGINQEIKSTYLTETIVKLEIVKVGLNGTAEGFLYVESFSVKNAQGQTMAGLASIPAKALKSEVTVDKKGNFTFLKTVYVLVQEKGNTLVSAKASATETSATGTATLGTTEVTVYAEFDSKTGNLKGGYTEKSVAAPLTKKIEIKAEDSKIDIIPYDVLDLLALPEGETEQGDEATTTAGYYSIKIKTLEVTPSSVKLENLISTNKAGSAATQKVNSKGNGGSMDMDVSGFGEVTEMDEQMNAPIGNSGTSASDMMPVTSGKINVTFNTAKGIFDTLNGTMEVSQDMMGVQLVTKSTIKLVLIP